MKPQIRQRFGTNSRYAASIAGRATGEAGKRRLYRQRTVRKDQRVMMISLTEAGKELLNEANNRKMRIFYLQT